jgi:hypothetical protein
MRRRWRARAHAEEPLGREISRTNGRHAHDARTTGKSLKHEGHEGRERKGLPVNAFALFVSFVSFVFQSSGFGLASALARPSKRADLFHPRLPIRSHRCEQGVPACRQ